MSIHRKKYPLNHAMDAEAPVTSLAEHPTLSDTSRSNELLEIENAIASVSSVFTTAVSKHEEDELTSLIKTLDHMNTIVYGGPGIADAEKGGTPVRSGAD